MIDAIRALYASMPERLARARRDWNRPLTLGEKILVAHADDFAKQEWSRGKAQLRLRVDRVALQDATGQMALLQFMQAGKPQVAVPSTVHCDHLIRAQTRRRRGHAARGHREQRGLRLPALGLEEVRHRLLEAGRRHHPPGGARELRVPGRPHDRRRLAHAQRGRPRHGRHRRGRRRLRRGHGRARLGGARPEADRRAPHGQALRLDLGQGRDHLSAAGSSPSRAAPTRSSSTSAPGAESISATGKGTICNMGAELGRHHLALPLRRPDGRVPRGPPTARDIARLAPSSTASTWSPIPRCWPDPAKFYDEVVEIDLSELEPHIVGPHSPDRARPISQARRRGEEGRAGPPRSRRRSSARAPTPPTRT